MREQNREERTEQSLQAELDRMAAETPEVPESFRQDWREAVRAEAAKRAPGNAGGAEAAIGTDPERTGGKTENESRGGKPTPRRILPWRRAMGTAAAAAILLGGILAGRDVAGLTRRAAAPATGSGAMTVSEEVSSDAVNGLAPALVEKSLRAEKTAAKEEARDQAAPEPAEETAAEITAAEAAVEAVPEETVNMAAMETAEEAAPEEAVSMAAVEMTAEEAADMAMTAAEEALDTAPAAPGEPDGKAAEAATAGARATEQPDRDAAKLLPDGGATAEPMENRTGLWAGIGLMLLGAGLGAAALIRKRR